MLGIETIFPALYKSSAQKIDQAMLIGIKWLKYRQNLIPSPPEAIALTAASWGCQ